MFLLTRLPVFFSVLLVSFESLLAVSLPCFSDQIACVPCFQRKLLRVLLQYNYHVFQTRLRVFFSVFFSVFLASKGNL